MFFQILYYTLSVVDLAGDSENTSCGRVAGQDPQDREAIVTLFFTLRQMKNRVAAYGRPT